MNHSRSRGSSAELLRQARAGDSRALSQLLARERRALQRWAHGRLPPWARRLADTADLVQDTMLRSLRGLDRFDQRGRGALQAYLRAALLNRIRDELRRVHRHPTPDLVTDEYPDPGPQPEAIFEDAEHDRRYRAALETLSEAERLLVVGRLELDYTYEQLALVTGRHNPDAARVAARRAVLKLAERMSRG